MKSHGVLADRIHMLEVISPDSRLADNHIIIPLTSFQTPLYTRCPRAPFALLHTQTPNSLSVRPPINICNK